MEGGRANGEKGLASSLALLPDPQEHICFDKTEFMRDNHRVEQFVSDCRRRVPLEKLREDLEQYFRLLKVSSFFYLQSDVENLSRKTGQRTGFSLPSSNSRQVTGQAFSKDKFRTGG